jgi:antirestriction protein ArdC
VWQGLGRQVRNGEPGITILAPVRRRTTTTSTAGEGSESTAPDSSAGTGEQSSAPTGEPGAGRAGRALVGFTAVTVFDLAQTDGEPLPEPPAMRLADGEAPVGLWDGLVEQVQARGFTVGGQDPSPALGVTRYATRRVDIAPDLSPAMGCHVLAHELGHIAADHETRRDVTRGVREAEADGIAHLVTTTAGLPGHVTVDYVIGWTGGDPAIVRATAARVVTAAAQIIDAIHLDDTPTDTQAAAGSGQLEGVSA